MTPRMMRSDSVRWAVPRDSFRGRGQQSTRASLPGPANGCRPKNTGRRALYCTLIWNIHCGARVSKRAETQLLQSRRRPLCPLGRRPSRDGREEEKPPQIEPSPSGSSIPTRYPNLHWSTYSPVRVPAWVVATPLLLRRGMEYLLASRPPNDRLDGRAVSPSRQRLHRP